MTCHHSPNIWTMFASQCTPAHPNCIFQPTRTSTTQVLISSSTPKDTTPLLTTCTLTTTCMLQWALPGFSGPCVAAFLGSSASLATMNQTYGANNQTWRSSSRMKSVTNDVNWGSSSTHAPWTSQYHRTNKKKPSTSSSPGQKSHNSIYARWPNCSAHWSPFATFAHDGAASSSSICSTACTTSCSATQNAFGTCLNL